MQALGTPPSQWAHQIGSHPHVGADTIPLSVPVIIEENGAAEGTRTPDPRITNAMLYQLSYCGPGKDAP